MPLFGFIHILLIVAIAAIAAVLAFLCRRRPRCGKAVRLVIGYGLVLNEAVWWAFRYSQEGIHLGNLPLQLCDVTLWTAAVACLTLLPGIVEFAYFAGLSGAAMAILTPDLWSPWPSYPAFYFFAAHAGIVAAAAVTVFGGLARLRPGAPQRTFAWLLAYAAALALWNAATGSNYMYLCRKPASASILDALGPWPIYLFAAAAIALLLFRLLWLAAPRTDAAVPAKQH